MAQSFKYIAEVKLVLLYVNWCNRDVIDVNEDKIHLRECGMHVSLECLRRVAQSESHLGEFE